MKTKFNPRITSVFNANKLAKLIVNKLDGGNITLKQAAKQMKNKITAPSISKYVSGGFEPTAKKLGILCSWLGVEPNELYTKS